MVAAAKLSESRGLLSPEEKKRINNPLENVKLPIEIKADTERVLDAMKRDKKREGESIHYIRLPYFISFSRGFFTALAHIS